MPGKRNPYYKGKVISVGKGHYQNAKRIPMDVEVGQTVLFLKNAGLGVELDDASMPKKILLSDTDIFAVEVE
jgi:co-chaperonin GroES (HSP10)